MQNKKIKYLIIIFAFFITGCEEENFSIYPSLQDQKILFQYEYINFAWGYQHSGWIIDSSGNVFYYKNPENWNHPDSLSNIHMSKIDNNLSKTDTLNLKIPKSVLRQKKSLIPYAIEGELSDRKHEMCDAGSWSYYTFIFDENSNVYRRKLLRLDGDFRIENYSSAAEELYLWMDSINIRVSEKLKD